MTFIQESSAWHQRRRRRQQITLGVIVLLLVGAGALAAGFYQGVLGGPDDHVDVSSPPTCATPKPGLRPEQVTVNVYNATSRDGLASSVAAGLRSRTFKIGKVANDPKHTKPTGTAVIRHGRAGAAAAALVAAQVPKAKMTVDKRKSTSVDLVVGAAFDKLVAAPKPTTATATPTVACTPAPKPTTKPSGTKTPTTKATTKTR